MSAWYELAYIYDIGVAQFVAFPRPLYCPSHVDGPVDPGPDVEAAKRACSRLGRWPWSGGAGPDKPGNFSRDYTDAFALGASPNVADSGIIGVQRQANIAKPSGAVGERTYDVLLYARVPKGLPHAGEFAMDARAIDLLQEAEKIFNKPNSSSPTADPRGAVMDHLEKRLGYTENPAGSNCDTRSDGIRTAQDHTANGTWLRNQPWCGCWCYYALETGNVKRLDSHMASVASIEDYARQGAKCYRGWTTDRSKVQKGDLVIVGGYGVHVETVKGFSGSNTLTIGGNTSPDSGGSQSNGGGAYARTRYPSEVRGYALVDYSDA